MKAKENESVWRQRNGMWQWPEIIIDINGEIVMA
jgi:hypothetical protein